MDFKEFDQKVELTTEQQFELAKLRSYLEKMSNEQLKSELLKMAELVFWYKNAFLVMINPNEPPPPDIFDRFKQ